MRLVDAVYERVIELVKERRITVNALANLSGVPRPTIVTMTKKHRETFNGLRDLRRAENHAATIF